MPGDVGAGSPPKRKKSPSRRAAPLSSSPVQSLVGLRCERDADGAAQMTERLGANLGNARLRQPEDLGNLVQLELLEVVEREHRALLFLQLEDRLAQHRHFLLAAQPFVHGL